MKREREKKEAISIQEEKKNPQEYWGGENKRKGSKASQHNKV